ncbi:MAG: oxygen-independent coproporphyrinogen III oxidase-like protein, partial [Glaciimonas sp.]|nr:oxygen-independent coproporphyrinogen III oxidase-like protein [Glaciimonas sp.]
MIPIKPIADSGAKLANKLANKPNAITSDKLGGAAQAALNYLQPGALNLTALPPLSLY